MFKKLQTKVIAVQKFDNAPDIVENLPARHLVLRRIVQTELTMQQIVGENFDVSVLYYPHPK